MTDKIDVTLIPEGMYCYSGGEWDAELEAFRIKLCPYWKRTDYGTVKCLYTGTESLTCESGDDDVRQLAYDHFGSKEAAWGAIDGSSMIWDQLKECGENDGYDEEE